LILRIEDGAGRELAHAAFRDDLAKPAARLRNQTPAVAPPAQGRPFG